MILAVHLRAAPEDEEVAVRAEALVVVAVVGVVSGRVPICKKQGLRAALWSIPRRDIPRGLAALPLRRDEAEQTAEQEGGDGESELHVCFGRLRGGLGWVVLLLGAFCCR